MSYVLDGGQVEPHDRGADQRALSTHELTPLKELLGTGKSLICFAEVATARARDFAAERADAALRLHTLLKARLVREHMTAFYETIERPLVPAVAAMENDGIKVDRAALAELSRDFARRIAEIEPRSGAMSATSSTSARPSSSATCCSKSCGLPGGKKGKTGAYGTDASILEQLAPLHPVPAQVLEWRQLTKLKSTYADALGEEIDRETGRVHTSFALAATATGRLSSTDPNLQNIPIRTEEGRKIRRAFVAEPGHLLLSADYSQIELRLAAHVADIAGAEARPSATGIDIHALTASEVFGVPLDQHGPDDPAARQGDQFRHHLRHQRLRPRQPDRRAAGRGGRLYPRLFRALPRHPRLYGADQDRVPRRTGYVETIFGRKCFIPGIRDANPARRAGAERQAINAPLQGSAADIIKRAMGRLPGGARRAPGSRRACCCRCTTNCCSRRRRPRSRPPPRSSRRSWKAPARRIANSRCRSSSKPAGPRAGTRRIN